jgi:hypothetical protein
MILEYKSFLEQSKNGIIIEVLDERYYNFIMEEFDYKFYSKEKNILMDDDHKEKLKKIEDIVGEYLDKINPFEGKSFNEKQKRERVIKFTLLPTEHWFTKFFRKDFEDIIGKQGLVNPTLYEGINMVYNNINHITAMIDRNQIMNNSRVLLRSMEAGKYSLIIIFEKINSSIFNIYLQTQMKGKDFKDSTNMRVMRLHPSGPLIK